MTVGELVTALLRLRQDVKAVVAGYEDGYNDVSELRYIRVAVNHNPAWYEGKYEREEHGEMAVYLNGGRR